MSEWIHVRPASLAPSSDYSFILSTWIPTYRTCSSFGRKVMPSIFYSHYNDLVRNILAKPGTKAFIAYHPKEPDVFLGYLVYEYDNQKPIIHFVFVKKDFRRVGMAKRLLKELEDLNLTKKDSPIYFTHWTFDISLIRHTMRDLIYDPFLAFY